MDDERRIEEIRKQLSLMRFPRRSDAIFLDENDHNPMVLEDCPYCHGSGKKCIELEGVANSSPCDRCDGKGITGNIVRYYATELVEKESAIDEKGWMKCPNCGYRFSVKDESVWTGKRHKRCGQKIRVRSEESQSDK